MTVAAVVLAPSHEDAHSRVGGVAAIRRIADVAWAGGALPIVIVPDGEAASHELGEPLSGAPGTVIAPSRAGDSDPLARLADGIASARDEVEGTDAALLWPGRYAHLDAETVTSLIEAHGVDPEAVLVPSYAGTPGWPILLPLTAAGTLARLAGTALAELAAALRGEGVRTRLIELGDPGIVHDLETASGDLPEFSGPPEAVGASAPDWGERVPEADPSPALPPGAR